MIGVTLLSKESQLITLQYHVMLLVALSLSFEIAVTRMLFDLLF